MDTFEQVWEASRYNAWGWVYYGINCAGMAGVIALSYIPNSTKRNVMTLALIAFVCVAAFFASEIRVVEKWRIRQNWVTAHEDQVTEEQRQSAFGDGANLIAGPPFEAFQSFLILVVAVAISPLVRRILPPRSETATP